MKIRRWWQRIRPRPAPWPLTPAPAPAPAERPLAVILIAYKMTHQVRNTLRSLIPPYQQNVRIEDYDIHVVDNGSPQPLAEEYWAISPNIQYHYIPPDQAGGNPGVALNRAVAQTRAEMLCLMIDGARMVTPGVLHWGTTLAGLSPRMIAEVRGWHLGSELQSRAALAGYNSDVERGLLESIGWPANGYRLFEISAVAIEKRGGFFGRVAETNCIFMSRSFFDELGGFDERYQSPGGGLCNVDFFWRATSAAERVFTVLGEGTFHQIHGGAATGLTDDVFKRSFAQWRDEYERISRPWQSLNDAYDPILAGHVPPECRRWLISSRRS
jgi:GT2 family glycosyltransferase